MSFSCPHDQTFTYYLHDRASFQATVVITLVAIPATISLNVLLIVAVIREKLPQNHTFILLGSMAIADLIISSLSMPITVAMAVVFLHHFSIKTICKLDYINSIILYFAGSSTLYHLAVIAWERNVAITRPLEYRNLITNTRVKRYAVFSWLLALLTIVPTYILEAAGVDYFFIEIVNTVVALPSLGCVIAIPYFYAKVFLRVRKRKDDEIVSVNTMVQEKLEAKVAKTTGILTVILLVSFLPASATLTVGVMLPTLRVSSYVLWTQLLAHLNSLLNPILYCYRVRPFRDAILEMLRLKKPPQRQPVVPVHRKNELARKTKHGVGPNLHLESKTRTPGLKVWRRRARSISFEPTEAFNTDGVRSMSAPPSFQVTYPVRDPVESIERKIEISANWSGSRDRNKLPTNSKTLKFPRSNSWHGEEIHQSIHFPLRYSKTGVARSTPSVLLFSKETVSPAEPTEGTRDFNTKV